MTSDVPGALELGGDVMGDGGTVLVQRLADDVLPGWLPPRRWFGRKDSEVVSVTVTGIEPLYRTADEAGLLCLFSAALGDGTRLPVAMPLAMVRGASAATGLIARASGADGTWSVIDGPQHDRLRDWLGAWFCGRVSAESIALAMEPVQSAREIRVTDTRLLSAEQSNTSIRVGQEAIVKLFRSPAGGQNPEAEVGRFLATVGTFPGAAPLLAEASWTNQDGQSQTIGVMQGFIAGATDGWEWTLAALAGLNRESLPALEREAGVLGRQTAELHLALASDRSRRDFAPEVIRHGDVERWISASDSALDRLMALLTDRLAQLDGEVRDLAAAVIAIEPALRARAHGHGRLLGLAKIRIHGDFHLGQTLRTREGTYVFLDFEGEPARSLAERRVKTTPLRDVAGMVRSFAYARGAATIAAGAGDDTALIALWERNARRAYLDAYVETARAGGATFISEDDGDLRAAVAAAELDKAIYEVFYELNNRPAWVAIPLRAMLSSG